MLNLIITAALILTRGNAIKAHALLWGPSHWRIEE
jgi:hypothetical protein